jgi:enoyl-CoA hydratase/carnithine racemase
MYRFFRSFEVDESVNHIWVENRGVNCFSGGVEFDDLIKEPEYLRKLFQLAVMIGKINKPVLGHVKGSVKGAAAYLLKMLSSPFGGKNANLSLDDINRGWIPTCGGSYQLSRMSGDIGTYLALTGDHIDADEMCELGFLYAILREGKKGWQYQR